MLYIDAVYSSKRRGLGLQTVNEGFNLSLAPVHVYFHAVASVPHTALDANALGQPVDKRPKAHALHYPCYLNPHIFHLANPRNRVSHRHFHELPPPNSGFKYHLSLILPHSLPTYHCIPP